MNICLYTWSVCIVIINSLSIIDTIIESKFLEVREGLLICCSCLHLSVTHDTTKYIHLYLSSLGLPSEAVVSRWLEAGGVWMEKSRLQLNLSKTECLWIWGPMGLETGELWSLSLGSIAPFRLSVQFVSSPGFAVPAGKIDNSWVQGGFAQICHVSIVSIPECECVCVLI